ncbi:hypothetical protein LTR85_003729 [Meristemomyces frigidus]|nr:hypothetical protein LTR85_003729 [Meristemomyces frigidus]
MRLNNGIEVTLLDAKQSVLTEHYNPLSQRSEDFEGELASVLVSADDKQPVALSLTIPEQFDLEGAEDVKVVIACGHDQQNGHSLKNVQVHSIDKANVVGTHIFDCFKLWDISTGASQGGARLEKLTLPDAVGLNEAIEAVNMPTSYQNTYIANKGCIAVFVVRGHLEAPLPVLRYPYRSVLSATEPPIAQWAEDTGMPKCIRWQWFEPLQNEHGLPYVFEFRHMGQTEIDLVQSDTATPPPASLPTESTATDDDVRRASSRIKSLALRNPVVYDFGDDISDASNQNPDQDGEASDASTHDSDDEGDLSDASNQFSGDEDED